MSEHDQRLVLIAELVAAAVLILAPLPLQEALAAKDAASWVQAIGSIIAIAAGFVVLALQREHAQRDERERHARSARACGTVALRAMVQVGDRLGVAAEPHSKRRHGMALREHRTTELVSALRELRLVEVHPDILSPLASLRSDLHAVNARISDIYRSEEKLSGADKVALEAKRSGRIKSSLVVYGSAYRSFAALRRCLMAAYGIELDDLELPAHLTVLLSAIEPGEEAAGNWDPRVIGYLKPISIQTRGELVPRS